MLVLDSDQMDRGNASPNRAHAFVMDLHILSLHSSTKDLPAHLCRARSGRLTRTPAMLIILATSLLTACSLCDVNSLCGGCGSRVRHGQP